MTDEKLLEFAQDVSREVRDYDYWMQCECCDGSGSVDVWQNKEECPECGGEGWLEI